MEFAFVPFGERCSAEWHWRVPVNYELHVDSVVREPQQVGLHDEIAVLGGFDIGTTVTRKPDCRDQESAEE